MKKTTLAAMLLLSLLLCGCAQTGTIRTAFSSDTEGVLTDYQELRDGTWKCENTVYQYRLELTGRMPNTAADSQFVVLTDNAHLTFDQVAASLLSSGYEDSQLLSEAVLVEIR